jgi:hypothetical protein
MRRLWYVGAFVLLAAAVVCVMLTTDQGVPNVDRDFSYQLPGSPPFLSEPLALSKAVESLSQVVRDPTDWMPLQIQDRKMRMAPDGTPDLYLIRFTPTNPNGGIILFTNAQNAYGNRTVMVELRGAQVWCTVSRVR